MPSIPDRILVDRVALDTLLNALDPIAPNVHYMRMLPNLFNVIGKQSLDQLKADLAALDPGTPAATPAPTPAPAP